MGFLNCQGFHLAGELAGDSEAAGNRGLALVGDVLTKFSIMST